MGVKCELIKDLLPLYLEGVCSDYTKSVVDEHIAECTECKYLLDTLNEQNKSTINVQAERNKLNPLKKIKRRNRIVIVVSVLLSILVISSLYIKLFQIGSVAPTSAITVESVEMFDDMMTFSIELSSNNHSNKVANTFGAQDGKYTDFKLDYQSGTVYIKANLVFNLPFNSNGNYKTTIGFDESGLGSDAIKAIYLVGKDANDILLIWEFK